MQCLALQVSLFSRKPDLSLCECFSSFSYKKTTRFLYRDLWSSCRGGDKERQAPGRYCRPCSRPRNSRIGQEIGDWSSTSWQAWDFDSHRLSYAQDSRPYHSHRSYFSFILDFLVDHLVRALVWILKGYAYLQIGHKVIGGKGHISQIALILSISWNGRWKYSELWRFANQHRKSMHLLWVHVWPIHEQLCN